MEAQAPGNQPPHRNGPPPNQKRNRKPLQHSGDIVYTKGTSLQTMPSLVKILKGVTECVIGLQYVWEYRSPSKSVQPHYQCKLCAVSRLQNDMLAHVKGWKHCFRYLKKAHPDKVTHDESDAVKDPAVRKAIKEIANDVEKTEGRGQLKVILKEPCEVLAFKGLRTAVPKAMPPPAPGMGPNGPPFGPHGYPVGDYGESGYGGFDHSNRQDFLDSGMDQRPYPAGMGHRPAGNGAGFGSGGGRDGYGRSGLPENNPGRMYPDEYRGSQMGSSLMDKPLERPGLMGAAPESGSVPNTLLNYLDTFRIENENDAQLVLKVTQKLTDVLMEYRLRSVSTRSTLNSLSMSSTSFSSTPPRMQSSRDRFSSSLSGPSRFSAGPPRYYK